MILGLQKLLHPWNHLRKITDIGRLILYLFQDLSVFSFIAKENFVQLADVVLALVDNYGVFVALFIVSFDGLLGILKRIDEPTVVDVYSIFQLSLLGNQSFEFLGSVL